MAVAKPQENKEQSPTADKTDDPSVVSSLAEQLKNCLDNWDTDHMAQVIHEGAKGCVSKPAETTKAAR